MLISVLDEVGNYNYGPGHPMKPHRIRMVHNLLVNYGVYRHLQIYVRATHAKPLSDTNASSIETSPGHCRRHDAVPFG